jgi:hypothetical protein
MLTRGLGCHPSGAGQGRERTEDGGREGKERRTEGREDLISFQKHEILEEVRIQRGEVIDKPGEVVSPHHEGKEEVSELRLNCNVFK